MANQTSTAPRKRTDEYGIERAHADEPGKIDLLREKWGWFDHLMRMQERFGSMGGNQYAAGITYFSVLSMFPILMLVFAAAGTFLVNNPETLREIQQQVIDSIDGPMAESVNNIIDTAIEQRTAIAGIGGLTALWSGLNWMNHLRYGVSKMWKVDPTSGGFVVKKAKDLLGLIMLIIALIVAFGITAVGSSGLTEHLLELVKLDQIPGIFILTRVVAIAVGLIANYVVFAWLLIYLPRTKVPVKSALQAAAIGACAFEVFKQIGSLFFSNALDNPAGATFGPIIGVMVLLFFIWRILLYCSAWAATTQQSRKKAHVDVPPPAIIRVRTEISDTPEPQKAAAIASIGAAIGVAGSLAVKKILNKKK